MLSIRIDLELKEEFLSDVLITAFDGNYGGCWYWAKPANHVSSWLDSDDVTNIWRRVTIEEKDDDGEPLVYMVDHAKMREGLQRLVDRATKGEAHPTWVQAILAQDAGDLDADAADVIIQYALFDEVKYG